MFKNLTFLLVILCLVISLVGCSGNETKVDACYACQQQKEVTNFKKTGYYLCSECASNSTTRKCSDCGKNGVVAKGSENNGTWLCDECYADLFTTYLGFPAPGFWSTDYFSILPWFFLYTVGYFLYGLSKNRLQLLTKSICPPLGWIGRKSVIIYMLHQPLVYGLLYVWYEISFLLQKC